MRRSSAITLRDVALEAKVAKVTASVVLNGAQSATHVSEATRARILEAAERLGYRRNGVARGLSRRRMDVLGVVAVCGDNGLQEYFLEVFNGIVQASARHGQSATVFGIPGWETTPAFQAHLLSLCDGRVDGLIFLGPHRLDYRLAESIQRHTALVAIHAADAPEWLCNADIDNEGGTYAATRYLIELGHRRIAHLPGQIGSSEDQAGAKERFAGYCRALEEAGIPLDRALVPSGDYSEESGHARTGQLLQAGISSPPTAFCCANDAIAFGCLKALGAHGLRVPEDVSVTGFDDLRFTQMITPPLTTIRQPFFQLGQRAVELLIEQIGRSEGDPETNNSEDGDDASVPPHRTETLSVELVVRGSTAPPPGLSFAPSVPAVSR